MEIKQLRIIQQNFLRELQDAYVGKKTSLPFIVDQIPSSSLVKDGEVFEVLAIGGSVWKKVLCQKTKAGIEIIKKETEQPTTFKTESDFLSFIDHELSDKIRVLAINFAYPLKPIFENGRLDGVLLAVSKENKFIGLVGKKIGLEIEKHILKKREKFSEAKSDLANAGSRLARKMTVSVANDTICLLLSGLTRYSFDNLVAGIVGTGLNFAFFLREDRLVNLESANFDKFLQSLIGKIVDQKSDQPGKAIFEKETAGAYLYKHFNIIIKERKIDFPPIGTTEELNNISFKQIPRVSEITQGLLKRSAQLIACQIAGITAFKNHDMVFNMEGSLFWKGNGYKEIVEQTVKQLIPEYNIKFAEIKDSGILGAAKLVS